MDHLKYQYKNDGNQLLSVTENSLGNTNNKLGDFTDNNPSNDDYGYDANGNLIFDKNKNIGSITYNHLNLPLVITLPGKGSITYTYDAAGNKLQKKVVETGHTLQYNNGNYVVDVTSTTHYMGGFVYESKSFSNHAQAATFNSALGYSNKLQFFGHAEGRVRVGYTPATTPAQEQPQNLHFDYFIKDHLGNVRMVLTDEQRQDIYPATTFEDANCIATEQQYYAINNDLVVASPPALSSPTNQNYQNNNGIPNPGHANPTGVSAKMYKLNGNVASGKLGLGITLKVMAGDVINVFGKSFYINQSGSAPAYNGLPILDLLNGFLNTAGAAMAGSPHGPVTSTAINTPLGTASINSMISQQNSQNTADPLKPRAFINVLFFDEQFRSYQYRISGVGANGQLKDHNSELQNILAAKNGYVYIYCSNESSMDVFFDNVQVTHTRGALLEETHYYPFGLVMSGISSKSAGTLTNKYKFGGKELQSNEFSDNSGLEMYDFGARNYDQQIGRFHTVDPLASKFPHQSPYSAMDNDPINKIDPTGMAAIKPDDWVEDSKGNVTWRSDVTADNYKTLLKDGETYRGTSYQREKIWNNVKLGGETLNGLMSESYNSNGKMTYENLTPWVNSAFNEMSKNITETGSNPEITKYWQYTQMPGAAKGPAGDKNAEYARGVLKSDKESWCAAFVNWNLETNGIKGTMHALAYSFKGYDQSLSKPAYGAIAVMNYSHVGIVVGSNADGRIILLGGNQGDAVNLSPNSKTAVLQYRYPSAGSPNYNLPTYNLKGRSLTGASTR